MGRNLEEMAQVTLAQAGGVSREQQLFVNRGSSGESEVSVHNVAVSVLL